MKEKRKVSSGAKWESIVGYSRAIRMGKIIEIAGTTAIGDEGQVVGVNDAAEQTREIIRIAERALTELGGSLSDVIRTRIFTTNINGWEKIGKAHGEFFGEIKPVSTMVEVSSLVSPELLVEIEFTAYID